MNKAFSMSIILAWFGCYAQAQYCLTAGEHALLIGNFCSVPPLRQSTGLVLPQEYWFQLIAQEGMPYTAHEGLLPGRNDFAGYVPLDNRSDRGYLSINHEMVPGGVSVLQLHFDPETNLWITDASRAADFDDSTVGGVGGNCSGGITPRGTVITAEEAFTNEDKNGDGYADLGWLTEIDVTTATVVGGGKRWSVGHFKHENASFQQDERRVYFGEDGGSSGVFKFIMDRPRDLSSGQLYGLRLDGPFTDREPSVRSGTWMPIPNTTVGERNGTSATAAGLGVTNFDGVEDVEVHPTTGQVYFAAKGAGRVYRFTDMGAGVVGMETYVGGRDYRVETPDGPYTTSWGLGNDNLVFDGQGNLWVLQDGGDNYIWVVRPGHSQQRPALDIFARLPQGSEPTGLNFTPDYRYGFFSVQHPSDTNQPQVDASGQEVSFTKAATVVFSLARFLGDGPAPTAVHGIDVEGAGVDIYPNPAKNGVYVDIEGGSGPKIYNLKIHDQLGRSLSGETNGWTAGSGEGPQFIDLAGMGISNQLVFLTLSNGTRHLSRKVWINR